MLDTLSNLLFLVIGILIGHFLNKPKINETKKSIQDKYQSIQGQIKSIFIKPDGQIIDSKEVNSLNKLNDEVNYHHNDHFDEEQ